MCLYRTVTLKHTRSENRYLLIPLAPGRRELVQTSVEAETQLSTAAKKSIHIPVHHLPAII